MDKTKIVLQVITILLMLLILIWLVKLDIKETKNSNNIAIINEYIEKLNVVNKNGFKVYPSMGSFYVERIGGIGANGEGHRTRKGFQSGEAAIDAALSAIELLEF